MKMTMRARVRAMLIGDLVMFGLSLWLALFLRYAKIPSSELFLNHLQPFSIIFLIWALVFYIAGLYDKHTSIFRQKLPRIIFNTLVANSIIAVFFFYFIPYLGITPKTILFIDLAVSFLFIYLWRTLVVPNINLNQKERLLFACSGPDVDEIKEEVSRNPRYNITLVDSEDFENIVRRGVTAVVVDLNDKNIGQSLKDFYRLIFSGISFVSVHNLYEEIFDREPISFINEKWFLENISSRPKALYDAMKRLLDIIISLMAGCVSLIFYPFVYLAIKLDDGGDVFITQKRIGKGNQTFDIYKFRTMTGNETGKWLSEGTARVTRVGQFLRKTRIDELPQLWNVLRGDVSLIGPRPDIIGLDKRLNEEIPYYSSRTLVTPGLSGWALIKQEKPPQSIEETRIRLSYDLYYIKNRSFFLDFKIFLHTIRILLSRSGGAATRKYK